MPLDANATVTVTYRGVGPLTDLRLTVVPGDHATWFLELARGGDSTVLPGVLTEREARASARRIAKLLGLAEIVG